VRKDDDLLSVCSQSSEATSEAGSDKTDVSNGFAHKRARSNPYSQDQSTSSSFKKANAPLTTTAAQSSKASTSMAQPATSRVSRAINYNTTVPENKTTNSHLQDKADPPQQLTKVKSAEHNNFGAKPGAKSADLDKSGRPSRSRGGGADKAVLLENDPILTKPLSDSKGGVGASSEFDEASGSKPPVGGARPRSPAVIQSKSTDNDTASQEPKPVAGLVKRRGRPAASGGNNIVVASANIEANSSSDKPNMEDTSDKSKIKSSSEETSVPPPTKRRLRGGLAAKPPVLETAKTAPAPVVKTNTVIEEPQKAQEPIEAAAAVAPKRKFFKSKAAAAAPKSSTTAASQPTTTTIKTEPNKIEFSYSNLKKENLEVDFDLKEGLVKPEPFTSKPSKQA
jgi:hypothetical protein